MACKEERKFQCVPPLLQTVDMQDAYCGHETRTRRTLTVTSCVQCCGNPCDQGQLWRPAHRRSQRARKRAGRHGRRRIGERSRPSWIGCSATVGFVLTLPWHALQTFARMPMPMFDYEHRSNPCSLPSISSHTLTRSII